MTTQYSKYFLLELYKTMYTLRRFEELGIRLYRQGHIRGNLGANGIVGSGAPIGVGAALGTEIRGEDRVSVIFIEYKQLYMTEGEVPEKEYCIDFGKGDIKRDGKDLTIIARSNMVHRGLEAAKKIIYN